MVTVFVLVESGAQIEWSAIPTGTWVHVWKTAESKLYMSSMAIPSATDCINLSCPSRLRLCIHKVYGCRDSSIAVS